MRLSESEIQETAASLRASLQADTENFLKLNGGFKKGDAEKHFYDSEMLDAWAASKGYHVDRTLRAGGTYGIDGDYDVLRVCAYRDGFLASVIIWNVISLPKQWAAHNAETKKDAA